MTQLTIATTDEALEALSAILLELGLDCFEIKQSATAAQAFLEEHATAWDGVEQGVLNDDDPCVILTLENEDDIENIKQAVETFKNTDIGLNKGTLIITTKNLPNHNWETQWQEHFAPVEIGQHFLLSPPWENQHNTTRRVLRVNPGSVFGTGRHESTSLCIRLMERINLKDISVLDAGCGSGILGLAALMLGAQSVLGVDIDAGSPAATAENALLNNLQGRITTAVCDIMADETVLTRYGLILANINQRAILQILPKAKSWLSPGGYLILSGLTLEQRPAIEQALCKNGYSVIKTLLDNQWFAVLVTTAGEDDIISV
ncbi:MAG: 50S ribosomal protein L11 methyltransferase [Clostridia bacterium]|nr:50S ribosomal protein L11 methyltransferase [Clostridia bacterium]